MCNKDKNGMCLSELLEKILLLQQTESRTRGGCDRPILGNIPTLLANTRPINLYCCCTNRIWSMDYNFNGETGTSSVFRVESVNENTATLRILIPTEAGYTATDNFFTIDLDFISCIKCLNDSLVTNL